MVKILIATPTYDGKEYVLDYWAKRMKKIIANSPFQTDFLIVDNSETKRYAELLRSYGFEVIKIPREKESLQSLANARKIIHKEVISGDYDFLLSIEQDVLPPLDIVEKLHALRKKLTEEKAIIGVPYIIYHITESIGKKHNTLDHMTSVAKGTFWHEPYQSNIQEMIFLKDLPKKELMKCYAVAYGFTLLDRAIIKEIPLRFIPGKKPDDSYFYEDCKKKEIPVYSANLLFPEMKHFPGSAYEKHSWKKS